MWHRLLLVADPGYVSSILSINVILLLCVMIRYLTVFNWPTLLLLFCCNTNHCVRRIAVAFSNLPITFDISPQ